MSLGKKLFLKPGYRLVVLNAPEEFSLSPDDLPENVEVTNDVNSQFQAVLLFASNQEELNSHAPPLLSPLEGDALFWVAYPKKSSKIKSDISRDQGWELLKEHGYVGVSLVSVDDTWSAFRVRHQRYIKK